MSEQGLGVTIPEFVIQEAREKCFEIEIKTAKQFSKEKKNFLDVEKPKVLAEFETKCKREEMDQRIRRSTSINKARLSKMEARNKAVLKIFSETQYNIYQQIKDEGFYKKLLKQLMLQGLVSLFEHNVKIRCLEKDQKLIQSIIPEVQQEFQQLVKKELEKDFKVNLSIFTNVWMEQRVLEDTCHIQVSDPRVKNEAIEKSLDDKRCFGGVVLSNTEGNIICKNTLDGRIEMCFQESLPDLRAILFPQ